MRQVRFDHPGLVGISATALGFVLAVAAGLAVNHWQTTLARRAEAEAMTGGDASRAPALLRHYGCSGCHTIPGVSGADGQVGGPLGGIRQRVYVAGVLTNTPDNLARWITHPEAFSPQTAMPSTGITPREARDVAAYLYAR